jgi:hypothetical protein
MPRKSQDFVFIYGSNTQTWKKALLEKHRIDPNRLSRVLGGSGPDGLDFQSISSNGNVFQCP